VDLRKEMFTAACARGLTGCDTEDREDRKEELLGEHGGWYYAVEKLLDVSSQLLDGTVRRTTRIS
jgi:hypothetical protein